MSVATVKHGYQMTLEEVAKEFGVTSERIRQIENHALCKLRHPSRSKLVLEFLEPDGPSETVKR